MKNQKDPPINSLERIYVYHHLSKLVLTPSVLSTKIDEVIQKMYLKNMKKYSKGSYLLCMDLKAVEQWERNFSALFANDIKNGFKCLKRKYGCEISQCTEKGCINTSHRKGFGRKELTHQSVWQNVMSYGKVYCIDVRRMIESFFLSHLYLTKYYKLHFQKI